MIIVTTKEGTIYLNEKEFLTVDFRRKEGELYLQRKNELLMGPPNKPYIEDVVSVRYMTDATPADNTSVCAEWYNKVEQARKHFIHQYVAAHSTLRKIHEACEDKSLKHKDAREKIKSLSEECFIYLDDQTNQARKDGILK